MVEDTSILQEIDEALRADKVQQLWARHSGLIIACCVMMVLSSAISVLWRNHRHEVQERETSALLKAASLEKDGKASEAADAYGKIAEEGGGLAALAGFKRAEALSAAKQDDKAVEALNDVAAGKMGGTSDFLRDYAALGADIIAHNRALETGKAPAATEGWKQAIGGSRPLWSFFAETQAVRLAGSDPKTAASLLTSVVSDDASPPSERMRADQLLESIKENSK